MNNAAKRNVRLQDSFPEALQGLFGNKYFCLQMLEKFPFPIGVFSPNGTLVFVNPIFLEKGIIPEPDVAELCFHPVLNGEELICVISVFIVNKKKEK